MFYQMDPFFGFPFRFAFPFWFLPGSSVLLGGPTDGGFRGRGEGGRGSMHRTLIISWALGPQSRGGEEGSVQRLLIISNAVHVSIACELVHQRLELSTTGPGWPTDGR